MPKKKIAHVQSEENTKKIALILVHGTDCGRYDVHGNSVQGPEKYYKDGFLFLSR